MVNVILFAPIRDALKQVGWVGLWPSLGIFPIPQVHLVQQGHLVWVFLFAVKSVILEQVFEIADDVPSSWCLSAQVENAKKKTF